MLAAIGLSLALCTWLVDVLNSMSWLGGAVAVVVSLLFALSYITFFTYILCYLEKLPSRKAVRLASLLTVLGFIEFVVGYLAFLGVLTLQQLSLGIA